MKHPLTVVLVRTLYSSNMGATSRAMVNMGFSRLVMIEPRCEINAKAHQSAAAAQGPMMSRIVYSSWDDFYRHEGEGLRIGLTRRAGKQRPVTDLAETLNLYAEPEADSDSEMHFKLPVYLIFGPENDGLNNEETLLFQHCCSIPTFGEMGSLNLAQAVLIALFMTRQVLKTPAEHFRPEANLHHTEPNQNLRRPFHFPESIVREWLETLGFDVSSPRVNALNFMKRLLSQTQGTSEDFRQFESILFQTIRKLKGQKIAEQESE